MFVKWLCQIQFLYFVGLMDKTIKKTDNLLENMHYKKYLRFPDKFLILYLSSVEKWHSILKLSNEGLCEYIGQELVPPKEMEIEGNKVKYPVGNKSDCQSMISSSLYNVKLCLLLHIFKIVSSITIFQVHNVQNK